MDRELRPDLAGVQVHKFPEGKSVPMGDLRDEHLAYDGRNRALDHAAGRIDMVHDIQRGGVFTQELQHLHQPHHVLCVVEVTDAHVLDFHDDGIQPL